MTYTWLYATRQSRYKLVCCILSPQTGTCNDTDVNVRHTVEGSTRLKATHVSLHHRGVDTSHIDTDMIHIPPTPYTSVAPHDTHTNTPKHTQATLL